MKRECSVKNSGHAFRIAALAVLLTASAAGAPAAAQDVSVNAYFNQGTLIVNQEAVLSVEITGAGANNAGNPELPDFGEWFAFAGSRGSSQNIQIINGRVSASITYNYSLIPRKAGSVKISPVKVRIGNTTVQSGEIAVEIKDAGYTPPQPQVRQPQNPRQGKNQPLDLFVIPVPDKNTVYQYEGVTIDYKVYIGPGVSVSEYSLQNLPNTAGFWTEEYPLPRPVTQPEVYNNKRYSTAVLKRVELFPTNSGDFALDPMQIEFTIRVPRQNRTRSFFDDPFFSDPFFDRTKSVKIHSSALNLTVLPLPDAGRPAGFNGAVGQFAITEDVDKRAVRVNDSVTLKIAVSGAGNIKLLKEPELKISGVYEKYDPQVNEKINRSGSAITGEKTFEYVIIPRKEGTLKIEPVVFAYFDPAADVYKTVKTGPVSIRVERAAAGAPRAPRNLTKEEIQLIGSDVRFIKESVAEWQKTGAAFYAGWSFLTLLMLPLIFVAGAFAYSQHLERLNADVGYKRSRRANAVAAKHLKGAKAALNKNDSAAFYPEVARALQNYIADKLNISAAGIVTEELEKILRQKRVDDDLVRSYIACLQQCDFHRFSSVKASGGEMKELFEQCRDAISTMENRLKKVS